MIKCNFCKVSAFRYKDGWTRLTVQRKGKEKKEVIGCPKHGEKAFEKFGKILNRLPTFKARIEPPLN